MASWYGLRSLVREGEFMYKVIYFKDSSKEEDIFTFIELIFFLFYSKISTKVDLKYISYHDFYDEKEVGLYGT